LKKLIVGSRNSKLAVIQAESVINKLKSKDNIYNIILCKISTTGDKFRDISLEQLGVASFVKELEEALLERKIDIAVHSMKDVPTRTAPGLRVVAVSERLDPRDVLISSTSLNNMVSGSTIATSSLRRITQLSFIRPDINTSPIRGNIDTRIRKFKNGEVNGLITAAAALIRMGWEKEITEYLPIKYFLPAVGQGALALQVRNNDYELIDFIRQLNDLSAWQSVMAERSFLNELGGGCRVPIAALGIVENGKLSLEGMVAGITSHSILRYSISGDADDYIELGKTLAKKMMNSGAAQLIAESKGHETG